VIAYVYCDQLFVKARIHYNIIRVSLFCISFSTISFKVSPQRCYAGDESEVGATDSCISLHLSVC